MFRGLTTKERRKLCLVCTGKLISADNNIMEAGDFEPGFFIVFEGQSNYISNLLLLAMCGTF